VISLHLILLRPFFLEPQSHESIVSPSLSGSSNLNIYTVLNPLDNLFDGDLTGVACVYSVPFRKNGPNLFFSFSFSQSHWTVRLWSFSPFPFHGNERLI